MENEVRYMVFAGNASLVSGDLRTILLQTKQYLDSGAILPVLIFEEQTGKQVDFDFQGTAEDIIGREIPSKSAGPGRPKLGVVSREVSLLPRHWEWLEQQPNGISAALRKLVEEAKRRSPGKENGRLLREAAGRFMTALAGNLPHFEEAYRALYLKDRARLNAMMRGWPGDICSYIERTINEAEKAEAQ